MTACNTGGKNCRLTMPSTPGDSMTQSGVSNAKVPLHMPSCPMGRMPDHQFFGTKRFIGPETTSRDIFPLFPNLDVTAQSSSRRPAIPSLKLKPRTRAHTTAKTKSHTKPPPRWLSKPSHADATLMTPISNNIPSIESPAPLRERRETISNSLVVGKSLLRTKHIEHSKTIGEQEAMKIDTKRTITTSFCKHPPKLSLKPRRRVPSSPSTNKENRICGKKLPHFDQSILL